MAERTNFSCLTKQELIIFTVHFYHYSNMKIRRGLKKGLGILLIAIFVPVQLLFCVILTIQLFTGGEEVVQISTSFLFVMALFFFPLWWGVRLWKESASKPPVAGETDPQASIRMSVKVELPEYRKLVFRQTYANSAFILIHIIAIALLFFYSMGGDPDYFTLFLILFILVLPVIVYLTASRNYKATKTLHEPLLYEFAPEAVSVSGESFNTTIKWAALHKMKELNDWFLLYTNKQVAMLVPKNKFASSEDMAVFRKMSAAINAQKV
jgi:hypothetical protein